MVINWLMVTVGAAIAVASCCVASPRFPEALYGIFTGVVSLSYGLGRIREQGGQTNV